MVARRLTCVAGIALLLAGTTALRAQAPGEVGFPYGDLKTVTLRGKIVDLGAEMSRKYGARTAGASGPQWALALPEGEIYTFLDNDACRKLLAAAPAGAAVEVAARGFPRSMLLEVTSFRPIDPDSLQRRFRCDVCDITTSDWGPCICCGKEMQPLPQDR